MSKASTTPVKITIAAVALIAAVIIVALQMGGKGKGPPAGVYYFDLGSGEIFTGPVGLLPVSAPSGSQGVRAQVFTCGACRASEWKVLSITSYTPEAIRILTSPKPADTDAKALGERNRAVSEGQLIALPPKAGDEPRWISHREYASAGSRDPVAAELRSVQVGLCGGKSATICEP